ncbi:MAG: Fe-S cluster assembly sulfur transfer protein SufU [archaeon]
MTDPLYREMLLDHYKHQKNRGRLTDPDGTAHDANPMCGDVVDVDVKIKDGKIVEIGFDGHGCAICMASASLLSEKIKGGKVEDVMAINQDDVLGLLGIETLGPARIKCAMLPAKTMKLACIDHLTKSHEENSTTQMDEGLDNQDTS